MNPSIRNAIVAGVATALVVPTAIGIDSANAEKISNVQQNLNANLSTPADPGEYPFAVHVGGCTGSLIHPRWVLTAAHCLSDDTDNDLRDDTVQTGSVTVRVGRSDLDVAGGETFTSNTFVVHPDYLEPTSDWDQDLALVQLPKAAKAKPVELVSPYRDEEIDLSEEGDQMLQLGYGETHDDWTNDDNLLREGPATIASIPAVTSDAQATHEAAGELQCRGDSGGPWLVKHYDGTWRQFAVTSWSNKNGGTYTVNGQTEASACGSNAHGTNVRSPVNYDWIVSHVYPDGMGRWLTRPIATDTGKISSKWTSNQWNSGWSIQEFFMVGGRTHILLYRGDTGEVQIRPMDDDGTPSSNVAYSKDWTDDWSSIRPYEIDGRVFLFEIKVSTGEAVIDEVTRNSSTGKITLTERFRQDWTPGWTAAEPYSTSTTDNGVFLLKESTGQVKSFRLLDHAPWIDMTKPTYEADWSSGWSNVRFFYTWGGTYLYLMKDTTGEVHIHKMDDLKVSTRYRDESVGTGWETAEVSRTLNGGAFLTLQDRHSGALQVRKLNEVPSSKTNSMLGQVIQTMNIKDGNTQAKPFCLGDPLACQDGQYFLWNYREGRI